MFAIQAFAGDGKSFFALKSSASVPIGNYSLKNIDKGCFTTTGISFGAEGAWFFWKNIGVGAEVNFSIHPVDAVGLATAKVFDDPFMEDLYVRSDPYNMLTSLIGFYYRINLGDKFFLQPSLKAGVLFGKTPFQLYEPKYFMVGPDYYKVTSSRDSGFAIKPGLAVIYSFNNYIALGLNADFTFSELSFGFSTSNGLEYRDRQISYFDFGLSLIIYLSSD